jgi:hypothetical protein
VKTPILGSAYVARSVNAADNRMVNLYPEIIPEGGKEPAFLRRTPGLSLYYDSGSAGVYIRGVHAMNVGGTGQRLFFVLGQQLYSITAPGGPPTFIGNIGGSNTAANVHMADNGTQLFVLTGGPIAYIYDTSTSTLSLITDADFPGANSVTYLDGFFVINQGNTQKIWVSALLDGLSWDALDFASAEGSPDFVIAVIAINRELWVLGESSTEVWYNAGTSGFPFAPIPGSFNEVGCSALRSVAKLDNSVFWLGRDSRGDGIIYRSHGYQAQRISTHAIEWQIQQYSRVDDAVAWTYQQDGHLFYVLNFPTADATWVYDVATGAWHERASWDGTDFHRHIANCATFYAPMSGAVRERGQTIVGDNDGKLYVLDPDTYSDNGVESKWLRSWRALPPGATNFKRAAHHSLQIDFESGVGTAESPSPTASLRWSDDGGHNWSGGVSVSMGNAAEQSKRVIWRRLGMTMKLRDRVYEVSGQAQTKVFIMGAELIVSPTNA